jgi:hypothetical protein
VLFLSVVLAGAKIRVSSHRVKGLREATAWRAALDAAAASRTIVRREGQPCASPDACRVSPVDQWRPGSVGRRVAAGPCKAEAGRWRRPAARASAPP